MDYKQALERLEKPRKQTSKRLGHKLTLYSSGAHTDDNDVTKPRIYLQYYNTNILMWRHDGGVLINADGFWDSRFTQGKITEYSPRGWRLMQHQLSHSPRMRCASIDIRSDTWELIRSMPYTDDSIFFENGRADHLGSPLEGIEATTIIDDVAATVEESVMAFLYGELRRPYIEEDLVVLDTQEMMGIVDRTNRRLEIIVDIAKSKRARPELVWGLIDTEYKTSFRREQLQLYDPKVYAFTGKPKSNRDRAEQLEHFMHVGNNRIRYNKNSDTFHAMKKDLKTECEQFLLHELGFQLKEFERRTSRGW